MISIIIPTYNRARLIRETINSILSQTYQDFELIIVDDHSTDNTVEVVEGLMLSDNRISYFKRPNHYPKGANSCRNYGFELSKGDFIKWLDSDDLLTSDALKIQLESLSIDSIDLSICNSEVFYSNINDRARRWGHIEKDASVSNFLLADFRWHTGAGLWRKSYFSDIAPWKEGLMNSQEWLMHLTQMLKGVKIAKVLETLCLVRAHKGSISDRSNKNSSYYYNECLARYTLFSIVLKLEPEISAPAKKKVSKQFFMYHVLTLYRGSLSYFLKVFGFYFKYISFLIRY